jgi:galactokinase
MNDSGLSSAMWLQNMYAPENPRQQDLNIALELTKTFLKQKKLKGACRVHGGGFAGTIITFIPKVIETEYCRLMNNVFGNEATVRISINEKGAGRLN